MKRKPIKIDWDELESAFEATREDLVYYLDLVTGQVILEGEGEEADFEGEDAMDEGVDEAPVSRQETTRLYVEPPSPEDEIDWMDAFARELQGTTPDVAEELRQALDSEDPHDGFKEALRHHTELRDRWFLYRADRLHDTIDAWLADHAVHSTDQAPWKRA